MGYMLYSVSTLTLDDVTAVYEGVLTCNVADLVGNMVLSASALLNVLPGAVHVCVCVFVYRCLSGLPYVAMCGWDCI